MLAHHANKGSDHRAALEVLRKVGAFFLGREGGWLVVSLGCRRAGNMTEINQHKKRVFCFPLKLENVFLIRSWGNYFCSRSWENNFLPNLGDVVSFETWQNLISCMFRGKTFSIETKELFILTIFFFLPFFFLTGYERLYGRRRSTRWTPVDPAVYKHSASLMAAESAALGNWGFFKICYL